MSLADLLEDEVAVEAPNGKSVMVRPLTLEGVALLMKNYGPELESLFTGKVQTKELLLSAPGFVHAMIASATGDASKQNVEIAGKLPVGLQLKILNAIWELSAVDAEEVGKFVNRLIEAMTKAADGLETGSGLSLVQQSS